MSSRGGIKPVGAVLGKVFVDRSWRGKLSLHRVFIFWDEVVGPEIAEVAQPYVLKGRTLWVGVPDSVWMQQFQFLKVDILRRLNERLALEGPGPLVLEDIRFQLRKEGVVEKKEPQPPPPSPSPISHRRLEEFETLINSIKNDELRCRFRRLWLNHQERLP